MDKKEIRKVCEFLIRHGDLRHTICMGNNYSYVISSKCGGKPAITLDFYNSCATYDYITINIISDALVAHDYASTIISISISANDVNKKTFLANHTFIRNDTDIFVDIDGHIDTSKIEFNNVKDAIDIDKITVSPTMDISNDIVEYIMRLTDYSLACICNNLIENKDATFTLADLGFANYSNIIDNFDNSKML